MDVLTELLENSLTEMAQIGDFSDYTIYVYAKEANIPHFHFKTRDGKKEGCIKIKEPDYYIHNKYRQTLNTREIKDLINFLKSSVKLFGGQEVTVFEQIVDNWNTNNPQFAIKDYFEMPDYKLLNKKTPSI